MIKIQIATPKGELVNKEVDSIVVSGDTGQLGILTNRIPVITKITKGYIKINESQESYVAIINGVLDFKDNVATVIAQTAAVGETAEEAFEEIERNFEEIKRSNKQKTIDFVEAEKELVKNIKEIKAAHLD